MTLKQYQYDGGNNVGWLHIYADDLEEANRFKSELDFTTLIYNEDSQELYDSLKKYVDKDDKSYRMFLFNNSFVALLLYAKDYFEAENIKLSLNESVFKFLKVHADYFIEDIEK